MVALYILLALLAVVVILLFIRIGLVVEYIDRGLIADFKIGPFHIRIAPKEDKEKKTAKSRKRKAKKAPEKPAEDKKAGRVSDLKQILHYLTRAFDRLGKRPRIDEITVHYMAAGNDPVAVALSFGGVSAGMGMITSVLEQNFDIKKRDFKSSFNFEVSEPYIYVRFQFTLTVWKAIDIGYPLISIITNRKNSQIGKEVK